MLINIERVNKMCEINYLEKICIREEDVGVFFDESDIKKINEEEIIAVKPPMGDATGPKIIVELSSFLFETIASGVVYDKIKEIFLYLKNKFKNKNGDPKPSLVLQINNYKDISANINVDLDSSNCEEAIEKVQKMLDIIKE